MKTLIALGLCLTSTLSFSAESVSCTLVPSSGGNFPFSKVAGDATDSNSDLHSIEKKVIGKVSFFLKEGHGILRLEAYRDNKFVASSMVSYIDENTVINLSINDEKMKGVEAFCDNLLEL